MAKYEIYCSASGDWRWRLKAANGELVASGEGYVTRHGERRGIEAHRRAAATLQVREVAAP